MNPRLIPTEQYKPPVGPVTLEGNPPRDQPYLTITCPSCARDFSPNGPHIGNPAFPHRYPGSTTQYVRLERKDFIQRTPTHRGSIEQEVSAFVGACDRCSTKYIMHAK